MSKPKNYHRILPKKPRPISWNYFDEYHKRHNKNWDLYKEVFKRDNWTCQWGEYCIPVRKGQWDGLIIHHIDGVHHNHVIDNMIVLCQACHMGFHQLERKYAAAL